ncbi:uncharacterized protein LOC107782365 [Nicotiana tabacum]|uniref:Uncharacterized protein LOC107782365 n=1 Tax=Nicotiana tabacum TaxID=4097 RepID=A0A1S3Z2T2_TOBAC|nr:PREDICTED: uncharacterized protein LOC107782365 [Nicotiana tabacum]XP_018622292.1 uncharacterized protein LOC104084489 isoform X1 [Nicotiana tomentosiformis]XP_033508872.1 uncharacterized protein LOC104084489 isoform X2 [Nicotiana tomentosiformis]
MAANDQESRVPLKLLVDDKKNRVIAAESNRDFVDILFSFLTFPIGTIIRLTNSQPMSKISPISTCMNNLYRSVENLSVKHLYSENCKSVLLNPRNPCNEDCFKLKVNIDDSVSNKYFKCSKEHCSLKSWLVNVKCYCGGRTTKEIFSDIRNPTNDYYGVFLMGGIEFIISDDLRVLPGSPSSLVKLLSDDLGYSHMNQIREMSVEVGKEEILRLLTCSLISKSPLTEVFLNKKANIVDNNIMPEPRISPLFPSEFQYTRNSWKINLKLILSKSRNKILYAEANDSFVDFLFSFLTFPIGSVIRVLNGISGLGCIDNLYKSVTDLESKWFPYCQDRLLNPGVAPRHRCQNQLLPISVEIDDHSLLDPRCTSGGTSDIGRLTLSPSLFIVSDDLVVRPMCSTTSFGLLKELNVPLCDIEEQVIFIDKAEARLLLQAAFIGSSSALTLALSSFLNKPKQEKD